MEEINTINTQTLSLPVLSIPPKYDLQASGPVGSNCRINARNDWEAIQDWLSIHDTNPGTYRIYRREIVRFFLWCRYKKGVTLAHITKDEITSYLKFLKSPDKAWCTNRKNIRHGNWKPFVGPLGTASYRTAVQIVNSLLQYLTDANYLSFNPMKLINKNKTFNKERERQKYTVWERILTDDEWVEIQQVIKKLPTNTIAQIDSKERTKFLFALLYLLGLRINEVASSTWNAFRQRHNQWWFFIEGKGGKLGHIPVNAQLLSCIKGYRLYLKKSILPTLEETAALLVSSKTKKPLKVRQLREIVKNIGKIAAQQCSEDLLKKQKLEKFSPHWLRHLSASHQDRAGVPFAMIKANHRHSSSQTTQIYIHADDYDRYLEMQKITMDLQPVPLVKQNHILQVIIKPKPMNSKYKFERLIESIERQLLKGFKWNRAGDLNLKTLDYETYSHCSKPILVKYHLDLHLDIAILEQLKNDVLKEAELRQFGCTVEIK